MPELELTVERVAAGGDGLAHHPDGRVVFVTGGLPGERVRAELTSMRRDFGRAVALDVLDASPWRVAPPCPHRAAGCGGCGWQHVHPDAQRSLKADVVRDALRRLGGIAEPVVDDGPRLDPWGFRTTVRAAVSGGRAAFRAGGSHDTVEVDSCAVAHPRLAQLLAEGRFGPASEVTLRCGSDGLERLALVAPSAVGVSLPDDVVVAGADHPGDAAVHQEVAGHRFRVSASSFFQTRPDGAAALVELVRSALVGAADGTMVDAYAGVGLFAATVAGERPVVAVERSRSSVADARHNLAGRDVTVVRADVTRWRPGPAAVVVADPARSGLERAGADVVAATGAERVVLVSCDPASLGRDARLLAERGYRPVGTTVVDLFPHTPHVEAVTRFDRG